MAGTHETEWKQQEERHLFSGRDKIKESKIEKTSQNEEKQAGNGRRGIEITGEESLRKLKPELLRN